MCPRYKRHRESLGVHDDAFSVILRTGDIAEGAHGIHDGIDRHEADLDWFNGVDDGIFRIVVADTEYVQHVSLQLTAFDIEQPIERSAGSEFPKLLPDLGGDHLLRTIKPIVVDIRVAHPELHVNGYRHEVQVTRKVLVSRGTGDGLDLAHGPLVKTSDRPGCQIVQAGRQVTPRNLSEKSPVADLPRTHDHESTEQNDCADGQQRGSSGNAARL